MAKTSAPHRSGSTKGNVALLDSQLAPGVDSQLPPQDSFSMVDTEDDRDDRPAGIPKQDEATRKRSFRTRTISTIVLLAGYLAFVWSGHVPCMLLMLLLQTLVVREAFNIARVTQSEKKLPGFRAQQWYFFLVATFYLYLRFIQNNLLVEVTSTRLLSKLFLWMLRRHTIISYSLYCAGFVAFVLSLKRGMYLYQFGQYAWTHMIIMLIVVPTSFFVSNIFEGIIWWVLPSILIIANDIFAYLAGYFWGKTPLIKLSPKKTWEGFMGGFAGTILFGFVASWAMAHFDWLTCPRRDLSLGALHCPKNEIYQPHTYTTHELIETLPPSVVEFGTLLLQRIMPASLQQLLLGLKLTLLPVQLHVVVLAIFASVIAPFGGFFASGFKRAFKMKDFGDTIPGHGGLTDRFDCQILMAVFSYIYYWNYVATPELNVGDVLSIVLKLNDQQQVELFGKLGNLLAGEGLLPDSVSDTLTKVLSKLPYQS